MYKPKWSPHILEELERNLKHPPFDLTEEKAQYRVACMTSAFPEALIEGYDALINLMPNDPKDRHVLAAAVYGKADAIITVDKAGFPDECLRSFGIERLTPDQFLVHQWHLDSSLVMSRVLAQVDDYKKKVDLHLDLLARMTPKFVELLRSNHVDEG